MGQHHKFYGYTSYNIKDWGTNKTTNILFVTGLPGSGKSSLAIRFRNYYDKYSDERAEIIHLDKYYSNDDSTFDNTEFDRYLNTAIPNWKSFRNRALSAMGTADDNLLGEWFTAIEQSILNYGEHVYAHHRLIVEGVQILDDSFIMDKEKLRYKPMIIMDVPSTITKSTVDDAQKDVWMDDLDELMTIMEN